jgi:micrococcal nuclease
LTAAAASLQSSASAGRRPRQEASKGKVTAVYDGDTVRVRLESGEDKRVRFIGVDSPELDDNREKVRLMAFLARRFTFHHLYGRAVTLTFDREREDAYGRLLAYVVMEDGRLFNESLVREGFAFAYLKFPFDDAVRNRLKEAEDQARRTSSGLWQPEPFPKIAPEAVTASVGKIVTVVFRCAGTFKRSGYLFLRPDRGSFEVLIQRSTLSALKGDTDFKGRTLQVVGFVELFRGMPQIVVGVASQLAVVPAQAP